MNAIAPIRPPAARIREAVPPRAKSAGRALSLTVAADNPNAWPDLAVVWRSRLEPLERVGLAFSAMRSLDPREAEAVAWHSAERGEWPSAVFDDPAEDAVWWVRHASRHELAAYSVAIWRAFTPGQRKQFLAFALENAE